MTDPRTCDMGRRKSWAQLNTICDDDKSFMGLFVEDQKTFYRFNYTRYIGDEKLYEHLVGCSCLYERCDSKHLCWSTVPVVST